MIFIEVADLLGHTLCVNAACIVKMYEQYRGDNTITFHRTIIRLSDGSTIEAANCLSEIQRCIILSGGHVAQAKLPI